MADDVQVMSGDEDTMEAECSVEVASASSATSSTDIVIDVVSTGRMTENTVSSGSTDIIDNDEEVEIQQCTNSCGQNIEQCSDCSTSCIQQIPENLTVGKSGSSHNICDGNVVDTSPAESNRIDQTNGRYHSDNESEIIVDDSPLPADNDGKRESSQSESLPDQDIAVCDNGGENGVRIFGRCRSVTPSPSYIRLATPSTPGTPRLRSGSVSGTTYAPLSPKPSPSARATPGERQRAGSMGEIEMRDKLIGRELKHGIRIIDNLDILQLPRPRNPGGILPLNGQNHFNDSNEALNLTLEDRQHLRLSAGNIQSVSSSYSAIIPSNTVTTSASKRPNTSYFISNIIRTTPNRQRVPSNVTTSSFSSITGRTRGCAINEAVERPLPSSVVDSEGVAKKIARLDSEGFMCSSTRDRLWNSTGTADTSSDHLSRVRVISDKTPPERPKPPRRTVPSPADNGSIDMTPDRSFVSSSVRRRLSPTTVQQSLHRSSTPNNGNGSTCVYPVSPDSEICQLPHHYKCRMCNYSSSSYNQLQSHSTKHGGNGKTFRCSLCDYSTHEKSNFRRHRRLHHKTSPVNVLKCVKCAYVTSISRKLREHYQQAHSDMPDLAQMTVVPGLSRNVVSPQRYVGPNGFQVESTNSYIGHIYDSPLMVNRNNRLGFPYSVTGRQPAINFPLDQYDMPYGSYRDRHGENLASNYLRSFVSSVMNSESSRQAATSTVTSSYYMPSVMDNSHPVQDVHMCNRHASCNGVHSDIKIKIENDLENSCDISSTGHRGNFAMPDITKNLTGSHVHTLPEAEHSSTNSARTGTSASSLHLHQNARLHTSETGPFVRSPSNDLPTDLTSPHKVHPASNIASTSGTAAPVSLDVENGGDTSQDHGVVSPSPSNTIVKSESTTLGIQCVLPVIKTEISLDGDYYDVCGLPRFRGIDRAVQCNISNASTSTSSRSQCPATRTGFRSQSVSESDASEHHSSVCGESRCEYCGINFEDEVLFSIHIGCHSHTDPFKCNVCGKQCGNKYGFYSHIMRGHQL